MSRKDIRYYSRYSESIQLVKSNQLVKVMKRVKEIVTAQFMFNCIVFELQLNNNSISIPIHNYL